MSNKAIVDYLTKQLYIERTIVTYRSLSREFGIHVNTAKNELATFHAEGPSLSHPVESFATYFVTGELHTSPKGLSQDDDEDDNPYIDHEEDAQKKADSDFEYGGSEKVTRMQMSLVSEENLEATKAQYRKVCSVHVYSLTPSPLREPRLICTVAEQVRDADSKRSVEMAAAIGRIINSTIQYPVAGPSKAKQDTVAKQTDVKPKVPPVIKAEKQQEKPKEEPKPAEKGKAKLKPAGSGKLDFFKPKAKETKKEETSKASAAKIFFSAPKKEPQEVAATIRGTKRKSIATKSDTEDDAGSTPTVPSKPVSKPKAPIKAGLGRTSSTSAVPPKPAPKSKAPIRAELGRTSSTSAPKVKGSVILSDEEEADARRIPRRKSRILTKVASDVDSDAENEARALMDIDEEQVTKVSNVQPEGPEEQVAVQDVNQNEDVDGDVEMEDEEVPKAKPRQRKPRKVVPLGRNGIKKKRVTRSRTTADEKGYMVTEDYSSYESVEEGETEVAATKGKGKGKAKASEEDKGVAKGGRKTKGQASLVSFFGPPKSKR